VWPLVGERSAAKLAAEAETDHIVILDIPLLVESSGKGSAGRVEHVIVVDAPEDVAVERLVRDRAFSEEDARARIKNQASRKDRLARASFVIDNSGSIDQLEGEVERCWAWLEALRAAPASGADQ